ELVEGVASPGGLQRPERSLQPAMDLANRGRRRLLAGRGPAGGVCHGRQPTGPGSDALYAPRAKLRNCVRLGRKVNGIVAVGPLRCLATMMSALPLTEGSSESSRWTNMTMSA